MTLKTTPVEFKSSTTIDGRPLVPGASFTLDPEEIKRLHGTGKPAEKEPDTYFARAVYRINHGRDTATNDPLNPAKLGAMDTVPWQLANALDAELSMWENDPDTGDATKAEIEAAFTRLKEEIAALYNENARLRKEKAERLLGG